VEISSPSNYGRAAKIPKRSLPETVVVSNEMSEVPAAAVEFPHDQGVAAVQGFVAGGQLRPVILLPRGLVSVHGLSIGPVGEECVR
jgi:hypothetical protein